jgi:CRP/FNR family cyclic AMP-dependent transcriptional regulator
MKRADIEATLRKCLFFKDIEKNNVAKIATLCHTSEYKAGASIFQQGDLGEYLYVIIEGLVELERSVTLTDRKGKVVIDRLGRNRMLGCWSTLLNQPHILMSSAICQKPTKVIAFKGNDLRRLMEEKTDLGFYMCERLCFLLRDRIEHAYGALEKI